MDSANARTAAGTRLWRSRPPKTPNTTLSWRRPVFELPNGRVNDLRPAGRCGGSSSRRVARAQARPAGSRCERSSPDSPRSDDGPSSTRSTVRFLPPVDHDRRQAILDRSDLLSGPPPRARGCRCLPQVAGRSRGGTRRAAPRDRVLSSPPYVEIAVENRHGCPCGTRRCRRHRQRLSSTRLLRSTLHSRGRFEQCPPYRRGRRQSIVQLSRQLFEKVEAVIGDAALLWGKRAPPGDSQSSRHLKPASDHGVVPRPVEAVVDQLHQWREVGGPG